MLIDPKIETILQEIILPDLEKGRKDFDRPHTEAVVFWMKKILKTSAKNLNYKVMITVAYAHDWGYIGLFNDIDSNDPKEINKRKDLHMQRGAEMIETLLENSLSSYYSPDEIQQVAHLVAMHDKVEELKTEEEITIMEADTLGMLDVSRVKPTFSKEANAKFMQTQIYNRRLPAFVHLEIKEIAEKLAKARESFFN